jgi:hypothetical protein
MSFYIIGKTKTSTLIFCFFFIFIVCILLRESTNNDTYIYRLRNNLFISRTQIMYNKNHLMMAH